MQAASSSDPPGKTLARALHQAGGEKRGTERPHVAQVQQVISSVFAGRVPGNTVFNLTENQC